MVSATGYNNICGPPNEPPRTLNNRQPKGTATHSMYNSPVPATFIAKSKVLLGTGQLCHGARPVENEDSCDGLFLGSLDRKPCITVLS